jgi:hypothetical protein
MRITQSVAKTGSAITALARDWGTGGSSATAAHTEGKGKGRDGEGRGRDGQLTCGVQDADQHDRGNANQSRRGDQLPTVVAHPGTWGIIQGGGRRVSRVETNPGVRIRGFDARRSR